MKKKRFKDPIYGYIDISESIISDIIDTMEFQRLRNIVQTNYSPLYSSAVHNRFVHSLGVYHLGCIATETIIKSEYESLEPKDIKRYLEIFELACLLHDLGHAPFSHTTEDFYLQNGERSLLHKSIIRLTEDEDLNKEIGNKDYVAAPHELMSVIVALNTYNFLFHNKEEKSFFARCIIGYQYTEKEDLKHSFLNCMISILNSKVIDVDKLDYLIRDAYITGFNTISIDYIRLLQSIRIRMEKSRQKYEVIYTKAAISVIENVVYAHDAERKWIQTHPTVLYETFLLHNIVEALKNKYAPVNLLSYNALTKDGIKLSESYRVSLLCDADILFLIKNLDNNFKEEFFQRKNRRHPLWKSEAEYKALFNSCGENTIWKFVENHLENFCKYLRILKTPQVINSETLKHCRNTIENEKVYNYKREQDIIQKEKYLKFMEILKTFATKYDIPFDFVILEANLFNSGFANEEFSKIQIEFDSFQRPRYFAEVTNTLKTEKSSNDKFFYLFYRRRKNSLDEDVRINWKELGTLLTIMNKQE